MMYKNFYFLASSILLSSLQFQASKQPQKPHPCKSAYLPRHYQQECENAYSPQTPDGPDHFDETQDSRNTILQSESNSLRSLTSSPEPQNPTDLKAESRLLAIDLKLAKYNKIYDQLLRRVSDTVNMSLEELKEKAFHAFYNHDKAPEESDYGKLYRILYQSKLNRPVRAVIADDTVDVCSFNPYCVVVNPSFLRLSKVEQELRLASIVERLNRCEFGINRIIDQNSLTNKSLEVSQLKKDLISISNIIGILNVLEKTVKEHNPKVTLDVCKFLEECEEEMSATSFALSEQPAAPAPSLTNSPRKSLTGKRDRDSSAENSSLE